MATMIPPFNPDGFKSDFERIIFEQLRNSEDTEGWYVFYSVNLANHKYQLEGEIDFVVVVPALGVLCLEIKGARSLRHKDRLWYYGDDPVGKRIGPFEQANNNRHSLREYLLKGGKLVQFPITYAVMFPLLLRNQISHPDDPSALEWHDWLILDVDDYQKRTPAMLCSRVLERWRSYMMSQPTGSWLRDFTGQPDATAMRNIVRLLKCDFYARESRTTILIERERETEHLTKLRESVLGSLRKVTQIIFEGPAGTGKTFIARALAKRGAEEGRRVLVLCHTNLLARWLECSLRPYENITVYTLSQLQFAILGLTPEQGAERANDKAFWDALPERALGALLSGDSPIGRFDEIIVDEGQDLFNEDLMSVLDLLLAGGWKNGRWALCGDWQRQKIFSAGSTDNLLFLENALGHKPFVFVLEDNCRNAPAIAKLVQSIAGERLYGKIERTDAGPDYDIRPFTNNKKQQELLIDWMVISLKKGFTPQDMVILSFSKDADSVAGSLAGKPGFENLRTFREANNECHIRYGTVHAFKGLDARAVIVTDVNGLNKEHRQNLQYVAASRARDSLVILVDKDEEGLLQSLRARKSLSEP